MARKIFPALPIDAVIPELRETFRKHPSAVLAASPGAGKTTRLPLVLAGEPWLAGKKLLMLEPRRLAAVRAAAYMAEQLGEAVGETVGYRIRGETRLSKRTRIEVVTEGVLTRLLQSDPALPGVALVIFDEYHERSIHADLGLALTLNVQEHLREDLKILVMSATMDGCAVASLLGDAGAVTSEGRSFPVSTRYLEHTPEGPLEPVVVSSVLRALRLERGDLLVFLPGQGEIRRVASLLAEVRLPPEVSVHMLFGDAPPEHQQAALAQATPGARKVILSTSVAETSLTIEGVRVVIDAGLARSPRFDPRRGMSGLVTVPVSRASADQRRGRAGRTEEGVCYRLWTERQELQLPAYALPEIVVADLASLALDLARWGTPQGEGLRFLDPPPPAHLAHARALLGRLGAIDASGKLTQHGCLMSELPIHPRFAHMLLRGKDLAVGSLACDVAALLEERDLLRRESGADIDLYSRWLVLRRGAGREKFARERALAQASRLRNILGVEGRAGGEGRLGLLLGLAYPERVAKRREPAGERYQMSGGVGALLPKGSALAREQYLAVGDVDGVGGEVKVFLAEPLSEEDIRTAFRDQLSSTDEVFWDERSDSVVARRVDRFGAIELSEVPLTPPAGRVRSALIEGISTMGLGALPWTKETASLRTRSEWLRLQGIAGGGWPDLSEEHLMGTLEEWLGPSLEGMTRRAHLRKLEMSSIVRALFSRRQLHQLDNLAPAHLTVPTGSHIPVGYNPGAAPILAVRLQEMFGQKATPSVGGGRVPVVLHLLSPAGRPLAITQDLPSFWKNAYPEVRKDMRGRYPKHHWPEDPLGAVPTKRTKRR